MKKVDFPQGTLEMLILRVLANGSNHGFGIAQQIHVLSKEVLRVEEGSLYPALHRMQERSWIKSKWAQTENNRRAKYYQLTAIGKKRLGTERESWEMLAAAIGNVLGEPH
ncbi:MAG: PadR family transcriptional regulator [Verrucomicrobia bacterium]|nr:PadR family transcriptional regulator [Verrucomicrobiota bacterium]